MAKRVASARVGRAYLVVDGAQVHVRGAGSKVELLGYLCVGHAACDEAKHLDLTVAEAGGEFGSSGISGGLSAFSTACSGGIALPSAHAVSNASSPRRERSSSTALLYTSRSCTWTYRGSDGFEYDLRRPEQTSPAFGFGVGSDQAGDSLQAVGDARTVAQFHGNTETFHIEPRRPLVVSL